ncbi:MAG: phospholipase D-like domain-containing protein [Gammaproteobacteria bacterium]
MSEVTESGLLQALLGSLFAIVVLVACVHALLNKLDPRSAALWIVVCLFFPIGGVLLYLIFGINRIHRRARARAAGESVPASQVAPVIDAAGPEISEYGPLLRTSRLVTELPLVAGCQLRPLFNGDQAFPEMLAAIRQARRWIYLSSYIFDGRGVGETFIDELGAANQRGVQVRVIIDGIGEWYDGGKARRLLRKKQIQAQVFLPPRLIPPQLAVNLRNHRKLLLVDGSVGFVGGMNIRPAHTQQPDKPRQIQDLAVRLSGPILQQLAQVAVDDWRYVTGKEWNPPASSTAASGSSYCRTIADGPDNDSDSLLAILLGAISSARQSIRIMTPYFLPPRELDAVLQAAARRAIKVSVILPERSDHRLVHWASLHQLPTMIGAGIDLYFQPPPFAHTKLLIIDDHYVQFGSANIDVRSLRLNFELMVESYDNEFAGQMVSYFDHALGVSKKVKLTELQGTPLWKRIRNAGCWLFSPNL